VEHPPAPPPWSSVGAAWLAGAMLLELRVQNLLLIESAELVLDRGLSVITGETGAGKTMLAHSLDLLLGGKPKRNIVRPGADEAYVEGVFAAAPALLRDPELAELGERLPLDHDELVLARRVTAAGRTRAYLQGRSVTAAELGAVGSRLLTFFGQHEHRRLVLASAQLEILDASCGEEHLARRRRFENSLGRARALGRELLDLHERLGTRDRDLDLLEFELAEIEAVSPTEEEEAALEQERSRLASVESLRAGAAAAAAAIERDGELAAEGAAAQLAHAEAELARASGDDPALGELAERTASLLYEVQDVGRELQRYLGALEADPDRLAQVEERLELYARLERKHGGSVASVLDHLAHCRRERDRIAGAGAETARLTAEREQAVADVERLAVELTAARERGARGLAEAVAAQLEQLAMDDARFEVYVTPRTPTGDDPVSRYTAAGGDTVEFMIAPNPGVPPGPLREIASGGELSRIMLALMTVATAAGGAETVVFDEVDAGLGGATARVVGDKLRALAEHRQALCITHLPQVASQAARHFRLVKEPTGEGTSARVERLEGRQVVGEICRMLGADSDDLAARRHAERLLEAA
jgi:DNA repair protein RecN (Recombination protein N)